MTLEITTVKSNSPFYQQLLNKVDNQVLHLQDIRGTFILDKVDEKNLNYFVNNVIDKPWNNHLLLIMFVYRERNADVQSISNICVVLSNRLKNVFDSFHLKDISEFDVEIHMYQYLKGTIFSEHSNNMRMDFLKHYKAGATKTSKWVTSKLSREQQTDFKKYLFPNPSFYSRDFSYRKSVFEDRKNIRKSETDAIVPLLPQIRAEGHFRCNQMKRLRQAFLKACEQVKRNNTGLPLDFSYDEPERVGERFYFRLWDKPSFVLYHQDQFSLSTISTARNQTSTYSEENNQFFVEFIKSERIDNEDFADGLWFMELFEEGIFGKWTQNSKDNEITSKRQLLQTWGYGKVDSNENPTPFYSRHKGILTPSKFISRIQDKAKGILIDVEPLYIATMLGLLALDLSTTTGARLNEILQLSHTKECIRIIKIGDKLRFSFYAVPKGRDEVEPFYISEQSMKLIQSVSKLLKEHYKNDRIPSVKYSHTRKHLFTKPKPYLFQYNYKALRDHALYSSLHFLLHGLRFETQEGTPVIVKTHLLRHAFATEAVQRQKMPVDIVAKILHQRDVNITGYYSEPTPTQVAKSVGDLHDVISDYIDIDETVLRSPQELEKELKEHKERVGVLNNVLGGTCVTDHICPIKMECLGCHAKIPEPEKKQELFDVINLSKDMEKRYSEMGLNIEVKKARTMRKLARNELKEIKLIEEYREEQTYEPHIQFDK
ncbi:site-specific integrase [Chengkuizengella axinellae]|uniref:Site-specific integrase n=1 Tax=Chengkuizengella axinellae TaxID=3064388 RepID=A0ABT9J3L2_9BACL|nr:site-specific integrase [Chengkuizengella sp. 2205SS18-9]MDP5276201.1 site-specific integrase [Chengkuizengella sp. 2205SS18-9]